MDFRRGKMNRDTQKVYPNTEEYLCRRFQDVFLLDTAGTITIGPDGQEVYDFSKVAEFIDSELIKGVPGGGKSKVATTMATAYWKAKQEPTLYLMLTKEAIKERYGWIETGGDAGHWTVYQAHDKDCRVTKWAEKGYSGIPCDCGKESKLTADRPTLAAVNVALMNEVTGYPTFPVVRDFPLWIIDEVDFQRFVGNFHATYKDIRVATAHHPNQPVRLLSEMLLKLIDDMVENTAAKPLYGSSLYESLDSALKQADSSLAKLVGDSKGIDKLTSNNWALGEGAKTKVKMPSNRNFPVHLVPIFLQEASMYLKGRQFNPRIRLVNQGNRAPLQIRWRLEVVGQDEGDQNRTTSVLLLDATADRQLLDKVFPGLASPKLSVPEWPSNVYVHQWADDSVSKGDLALSGSMDAENGDEPVTDKAKLESWLERVKGELKPLDKKLRVGVITHKAIHELLRHDVESLGFKEVKSMYFYNLRGSNAMKDCHVLVILGCPFPNLNEFQEECEAYLWDEYKPLNFSRTNAKSVLKMVDGAEFPVSVHGYWNSLVSSYFKQKCQAELYQALHRIRPYDTSHKYDKHIYLFTNMPVQDTLVHRVMVDEGSWKWKVAQVVKERLGGHEESTVNDLAQVVGEPGEKPRTVERRISDNGDAIAILAEAQFLHGTPGRGGTANRFARRAGTY